MPHARLLTPLLARRLALRRIVALTGSRQTGKTTLARDLLPHALGGDPFRYLCLDDPDERLTLARNPVALLDGPPGSLLVLDEVQKMPGLLDPVKLLADRKEGPRFLLLGSAQITLLRQVRETLAGRVSFLDLWPLSLAERAAGAERAPEPLLGRVWDEGGKPLRALMRKGPDAAGSRRLRTAADEALRWGGFPALEALPAGPERKAWLSDFRTSYLERDLADLGRVSDLDRFAQAQKLLAARTACLFSAAEVSRDLGVSLPTLQRYLRFLEISYQVFLLPPFHANLAKRLVRHSKLYWGDAGMARLLTERAGMEDGAIYETHVLNEILRWRSAREDPAGLFFYRTHGGLEVDFLLQGQERSLWIEARSARRVGSADAGALRRVMAETRLPGALGLLVHRGEEVAELGEGIWAVPDAWLFGEA